jgi:putative ATP-dependent endonuclease of the OLD family
MKIAQVRVANFRGIRSGQVQLSGHSVLVGDNNVGKSTLLEAIDLVMGPERLSRRPVVDEHDFYAGCYLDEAGVPIPIEVEVIVVDLSEEQQRHFREHLEWWNSAEKKLLTGPPAVGTDIDDVDYALRIFFRGSYDPEEDDFSGSTHYALPKLVDGTFQTFKTADKRKCGFLYLRTLRTGTCD